MIKPKFYKKKLIKPLEKETKIYFIRDNYDLYIGKILEEGGIIGKNGKYDYGLCQFNIGYQKRILSDGKNGKMFKDWFYNPYTQIDECLKLYKGGTKFYGIKLIEKKRQYIIIY